MKKINISICLIHNKDEHRLSLIRPELKKLVLFLERNNNVNYFESSYQPKITPSSFRVGVLKDFLYWKINREWNRYKKNNSRFLFYDILIFLYKSFYKYVFNFRSGRRWLRSCSIEIFLTHKHITSFFKSLYSKSDFLLVFEDDAIFKGDSIVNISSLIDSLKNNNYDFMFVDLAGGCSLENLGYDNLFIRKDDSFVYFSKPVTNTTCCYLINRGTIKFFCNSIIENPILRYIGADWMLNKIFMIKFKKEHRSLCMHSNPPFLNHGSVTGEFKSLIR